MGIFDIFARARANKPLTPGERALLKIVDGLGMTFLAAALPIVWTAFTAWTAGSTLNMSWSLVIDNAVKAGAIAVGFAFLHYIRAIQDAANGVGPRGSTSISNDSLEWLLDQVEALAGRDFGMSKEVVNQLLRAVESLLDQKLAAASVTTAQTQPVPVIPTMNTGGVQQIATLQTFQLPDEHVAVQTPSGLYIAAPADAIAPSLQAASDVGGATGANASTIKPPTDVAEAETVMSAAITPVAATAPGPEVLDPTNAVVTLASSSSPGTVAGVDTPASASMSSVTDDNSSPVSA